jgi:hypothetical protein
MSARKKLTAEEFKEQFGRLLDDLDAKTRKPGEPPLRQAIAEHAREELARMNPPAEESPDRTGGDE